MNFLTELIILRIKICSAGTEMALVHANLTPGRTAERPASRSVSISKAGHYFNIITQRCKMSFFMKSN